MAKIVTVDYEAMPGQAAQMRTYGEDLNNEMTIAYQSIADMHNSWYGKRYNSLVVEFNKLAPKINELLELVVGEIPFALETVANNYALADTGSNVVGANKTTPKAITDLAISSDVGMKFLTEEVTSVKSNVSNNFKNAIEKMNTIETTYNQIQWQSEAADAFRTKFQKLKSEIIASFENIDSQFTILMEQTLSDMQNTENANTVQ